MKKLFIFAVCVLCSSLGLQAQQKFNVQNGTKTAFYDNLETAVQQAAAGDTIYLPGVSISLQNELIINKKLTIVGTGWDVDSIGGTHTTVIDKSIVFKAGSDGSLITGCEFHWSSVVISDDNNSISGITIWRNKIVNLQLNSAVSNVLIKENWAYHIEGNNATNCIITNNYFSNNYCGGGCNILSGLTNSIISHNIIRDYNGAYSGAFGGTGCIVENNYFISNYPFISGNYNNINNNAFSRTISDWGNNTNANNLFEQSPENTFTTVNWDHPKYLTIKVGSPCKNAGTDGTDIGIYGGTLPYKAGAVPFNPHIRKAVISSQADKDGKLHVDIIVAAQDR